MQHINSARRSSQLSGSSGVMPYSFDLDSLTTLTNFFSSLNGLLTHMQKDLRLKRKIRLMLYGAATTGRLTKMFVDQIPDFEVIGFWDQAAGYKAEAWPEIGSFLPKTENVWYPEETIAQAFDAILITAVPAHYTQIKETIQDLGIQQPVYYVYRGPDATPHVSLKKPIVFGSMGRCGTQWLRNLLRFILGDAGYLEKNAGVYENNRRRVRHDIYEQLTSGQYVVDHFIFTQKLAAKIAKNQIKAVYLYRDPRDVMVSEALFKNRKVALNMGQVRYYIERIISWQSCDLVHLIRYEDLRNNTFQELERLCCYLNIEIAAEMIHRVIDLFSFKNLSGGRHPGQEDRHNHYRKGIVGDYRNHLSNKQIEALEGSLGDELRKIGYPLEQKNQ